MCCMWFIWGVCLWVLAFMHDACLLVVGVVVDRMIRVTGVLLAIGWAGASRWLFARSLPTVPSASVPLYESKSDSPLTRGLFIASHY
jgi:hypothetical protein